MTVPFDSSDPLVRTAIVVRPPDATWDGCCYRGSVLERVDEREALALDLDYTLVRDDRVCAVVAASREAALRAHAALTFHWRPSTVRADAEPATEPDDTTFRREYRWDPGAVSASARSHDRDIHAKHCRAKPCKAVWTGDALTLRASTGRDDELAAEAAALFDIPLHQVSVFSVDAPADQAVYDAAIDAALVARVARRSIEVWPERGAGNEAALTLEVAADVDARGRVAKWTAARDRPETLRPSAALLALRAGRHVARLRGSAGARVEYASRHVAQRPRSAAGLDGGIDAATDRAAGLFAHESFADEVAQSAGLDPLQWRLEHIKDSAGRRLIEQTAATAGWRPGIRGSGALAATVVRRGQGLACAQIADTSSGPPRRAWAAWVADVSVDASGLLSLDKITVGHHLDSLVIADASDTRWGPEVLRTAQALLDSNRSHDRWTTQETPRLPAAPSGALRRQADPAETTSEIAQLGALSTSDALGLPAAAAVANAIYDATGLRIRNVPFGLDLATLRIGATAAAGAGRTLDKSTSRRTWAASLAAGVAGAVMALVPWRPTIPPVTPDVSVYSVAAIERGRLIAAASDCAVCHTAASGARNAGGRAMHTPFGTIYTTNITPDPETGIGKWSFAAFDRAMRQGISRDGRHLYPAFPYTSFAKFTDVDMQALYAYLMSQPAVTAAPPKTRLSFPFSMRPAMAYWNLLFHKDTPFTYDPKQSPAWNRGAYLVQGAGHCAACHNPRNLLGAEKSGPRHALAGGIVDGWDAWALNGTASTTVPWTEQDLFDYLRTGFSERHGVAAGPMAPVVASLQALPDGDIRAMATYLASQRSASDARASRAAQAEVSPTPRALSLAGQNIYEGACAACHDATRGLPMFGVRPSLPLNTNVTADRPDNLIRIVLEGIHQPTHTALGYMPGFADTLDDNQIADLLSYLRGMYAPQRPSWPDLVDRVRRIRAEGEPAAHEARAIDAPLAVGTRP